MTDTQNADTRQARWARFRFSIIGLLLSSPPEKGELKKCLEELSKKTVAPSHIRKSRLF